jgi:hypothetical protein
MSIFHTACSTLYHNQIGRFNKKILRMRCEVNFLWSVFINMHSFLNISTLFMAIHVQNCSLSHISKFIYSLRLVSYVVFHSRDRLGYNGYYYTDICGYSYADISVCCYTDITVYCYTDITVYCYADMSGYCCTNITGYCYMDITVYSRVLYAKQDWYNINQGSSTFTCSRATF